MSDNQNPTGTVVKKAVNLNTPEDISYWTSKWNISREQLQNAVDRVGTKETRVVDYLRAKGIVRF